MGKTSNFGKGQVGSSARRISILIKPNAVCDSDSAAKAAPKKYSCWICDQECGSTEDYLNHLQAHKDAIERQIV